MDSPPALGHPGIINHPTTVVTVEEKQGPTQLCCLPLKFYPTHAKLLVRDHPKKATDSVEEGQPKVHKYYLWNARNHRKLRFPEQQLQEGQEHGEPHRFHLLSYEPHIVTWHICWVGVVANTLWVINGLYAVWPEVAKTERGATLIPYTTGVIGAFLFIVTGYLGYVEAITHTHSEIRLPGESDGNNNGGEEEKRKNKRIFRRQHFEYGMPHNPLGHSFNGQSSLVLRMGYPLIQDVDTGKYLTSTMFDHFVSQFNGEYDDLMKDTRAKDAILGRLLDVRLGKHTIRVKVESLLPDYSNNGHETKMPHNSSNPQLAHTTTSLTSTTNASDANNTNNYENSTAYIWWTNHPDLHHIGIFNSLVFFISTIIFFIPAFLWLPMDNNGATIPSTIFWVYVLQIIPSMGFIFVGHAGMAEASGSWLLPGSTPSIGWWVAFFNTIGGYGFLLYPVLALPAVVGEEGCCDELMKWGAAMATFWGSCAFWISGLLGCVEFSSEHPIDFGGGKAKKVL